MPSNEFFRHHMPVDSTTGARIGIDIADTEILQGLHFTASGYQDGASAVNVLITAPALLTYHFVAEVDADGPGILTWCKNPNATATDSTVIVAYNNNEDSTNVSTLTHVLHGTYTSSGTVMETWVVGGITGTGGNIKVGGAVSLGRQWRLGLSSVHLLRFVPTATCQTAIHMYYYRTA
jgi:hypothetical protein